MRKRTMHFLRTTIFWILFGVVASPMAISEEYHGRFFSGSGDIDYLQLLETSYRMFQPDAELQNMAMLYTDHWNGLVEGPTWDAWWVQNSYGTSYCMMPFLKEPFVTFLKNSQNLWFEQMGNGERKGLHDWVAPDGSLCDCARPGWVVFKQGDGRIDIHDWGMEFTAAGLLMQAEFLLISRDKAAIQSDLPQLRRCAAFVESRRDPSNDLFLAGPAGNLLAPSYAGWKKSDGTYDKAYLTGLSITYIAALDRLIELEKLGGDTAHVARYTAQRDAARKGLSRLVTEEGYFLKSLDPDGTPHGLLGAKKHAYFEAVCNHDAVAFRVVDDAQSRKIYEKIASLPGLRPHDLIITNWPELDDLYTERGDSWFWKYGEWVDGGHWTTCEARMIMAYYRVGAYEDARRSMKAIEKWLYQFRTDNPLRDFGAKLYQPDLDINCVYDTWGAPAAMIRGLFEYLYSADSLTLVPHVPDGVTSLVQQFPIRFGDKRLWISTSGTGAIESVIVNGKNWTSFDSKTVTLQFEQLAPETRIHLVLAGGSATVPEIKLLEQPLPTVEECGQFDALDWMADTPVRSEKIRRFYLQLQEKGLEPGWAGQHARLILDYFQAIACRDQLRAAGKLRPLPEKTAQAAEILYRETVQKLIRGLCCGMEAEDHSADKTVLEERAIWHSLDE